MNGTCDDDREEPAPSTPPGDPTDSPPDLVRDATGVLAYRNGRDDAPSRLKFYLMLCGGVVISAAAVAFCGCTWFLANAGPIAGPALPAPPRGLIWKEPLIISVAILMLITAIGFWSYRAGKRGLLIGLLIGFGITVLLEGLCFAL